MDIRKYYTDEEVIELTRELVRIPSHKQVEGREREVGQFILDYCRKNGLEADFQEVEGVRRNVIVRLPGSGEGKTLLFNGHMDTVPSYAMTIPPFEATVEDGFVWGRGGNDMKGGLACMITSMLALKRSGVKLAGDVILAAAVGEEEQSDGTEQVVVGGITADGAIVGEPSNYGYTIGHRGLEWLEIQIQGVGAHGGVPEHGVNAISKAAAVIARIEEKLIPAIGKRDNEYMGPSIMNFGRIEGGSQPSTVADSCSIQMDRRYLPGETPESVRKEYQDILDEMAAKDSTFKAKLVPMEENEMKVYQHAPLIPQPDAEIVKIAVGVLRDFLGEEPKMANRRGWTDAGVLSTYGKIPTVVMGPGDIIYSHTKDERVPVKDLVDFVQIYADITYQFCK